MTTREPYLWVRHQGITYRGKAGAEVMIDNQIKGVKAALAAGMSLKINSVLIPGVNDQLMVPLARTLKDLGVRLMNIMPLIPCGKMKHHPPPDCGQLRNVRLACETILPQFWWCK